MKRMMGRGLHSRLRGNGVARRNDGVRPRRGEMSRAWRRESRGNARRKLDAWVDANLPLALRARAKARWFAGWRQQLALLLEAYGRRREDGGVASFETHRSRSDVLYLAFRQLREELAFKLQDVRIFRTRHLRGLVSLWMVQGIEASTINLRLSVLRAFARWIGKAGVVPKTADLGRIGFTPCVAARHSAAREDKSWVRSGCGAWRRSGLGRTRIGAAGASRFLRGPRADGCGMCLFFPIGIGSCSRLVRRSLGLAIR